jgi:thiol-disulfide isomerase/thioredoxin
MILRFVSALFFLLIITVSSNAQVQYEISKDPKNGLKTLKGILSLDILKKDSAFSWMHNDISWYKPNMECVKNLTALKDTVQLLVFLGTWCEDSQIVFPQFLKLLEQVGFNNKRLTIIGVDRNKTTLGSLSEAMGVTKAPTIIVLKAGKEVGRVEEFGKSGLYDQDLGEILSTVK